VGLKSAHYHSTQIRVWTHAARGAKGVGEHHPGGVPLESRGPNVPGHAYSVPYALHNREDAHLITWFQRHRWNCLHSAAAIRCGLRGYIYSDAVATARYPLGGREDPVHAKALGGRGCREPARGSDEVPEGFPGAQFINTRTYNLTVYAHV